MYNFVFCFPFSVFLILCFALCAKEFHPIPCEDKINAIMAVGCGTVDSEFRDPLFESHSSLIDSPFEKTKIGKMRRLKGKI